MRVPAIVGKPLVALALIPSCLGFAYIGQSCSQLVLDRIDPLAQPGSVPAAHQALFVGGNGLNATMPADSTTTPADSSTCSTCQYSDDFSNYWFPTLYFRGKNGSYKRVKQRLVPKRPEQAGAEGAVGVWYFNTLDTNRISVFPQGFRMRHGNPTARSRDEAIRFANITYSCLNKQDRNIYSGPELRNFPITYCEGGVMTTVYFPECWDGKNLDSPDHSSHMANPSGTRVEYGGICPSTHPVVVPLLMMETRWDTTEFNQGAREDWVEGRQPFMWSNGDQQGYSLYADFVFGWKGDSLKNAFAAPNCPDHTPRHSNCGNLPTIATSEANKCSKAPAVPDKSDGWLTELPGGVEPWPRP